MKEDLSAINWNDELDDMNVNEQWKVFKDRVYEIQDKYVPKRKPRSSQEKKGKTNVDFKTLKVIKKKHRSWTRFMETRDDDKYKEYCKYRNQVVKDLTRKAIRNKEKEIVKEVKKNLKSFGNILSLKQKQEQVYQTW